MVRRLPNIAKVEGLDFIHDNFKHRGFETSPGKYKKWKSRKRSTLRNYTKGKRRGKQHGMLQKTGKLRRSWDNETTSTATQVAFTSSLPYAAVHNEGLKAGRPPGFKMPEREMIGPSAAIDSRIGNKLDKLADDIFK
ncbi:phage virion morphogenesis protein [Marinifilum flexuosum]|nr:phage virion morphogenesis protein [Marinifilum flexuosum]